MRIQILAAVVLGHSIAAVGAPADIQLFDVSVGHAVQVPLPIAAVGNDEHDIAMAVHGIDGTATAGIDYLPLDVRLLLSAGEPGLFVPLTTLALPDSTPSRSFSLGVSASAVGRAPVYAAPQTFPANAYDYSVALADVNGDGRPDIVACSYQNPLHSLTVSLNQSTVPGTIAFGAPQPLDSALECLGPLIVDINQDGMPDIVTSDYQSHTISVYLNATPRGSSTLDLPRQTFATGADVGGVLSTDFNGDGRQDLVATLILDQHVVVFLNQTAPGAMTAALAPQTFAVGNISQGLTTSDLNMDGKPDVAVLNATDESISVLLNTTPTNAAVVSFGPQQIVPANTDSGWLAALDVDGDGVPDLVSGGSQLVVRRNSTPPGAAQVSFETTVAPTLGGFSSYRVVDATNDGKPDLLSASTDDAVYVARNVTLRGSHVLSFDRLSYPIGLPLVSDVASADVDGDGWPDLVGVASASTQFFVMLYAGPGFPSAPTFDPPSAASVGTSLGSLAHADFNRDGNVDVVALREQPAEIVVALNATPLGAGSGTLLASTPLVASTSPRQVAALDVNSDGRKDVVAAGANGVSIYFDTTEAGSAPITFDSEQVVLPGVDVGSFTDPDLNGDGRPDLAMLDHGASRLHAAVNTTDPGSGVASMSATVDLDTGPTPSSIASGDVNGDGLDDVAVVDSGEGSISIYVNATAPGSTVPSLQVRQVIGGFEDTSLVAIADVNADGMGDIVAAGGVGVLVAMNTSARGAGVLTFAPVQVYAPLSTIRSLVVNDINGDRHPDILCSGDIGQLITVLINRTPGGSVTPYFDVTSVAGQPFASALDSFDVDRDGRADILAVAGADRSLSIIRNTQFDVRIHGSGTVTIVGDRVFQDGFEPPF